MTNYLFGDEILREDRRVGSYFIRYIPWLVILAALAVLPWILPQRYAWAATVLNYVIIVIPNYLIARIALSVLFGIIFIVVLIVGIKKLKDPSLIITKSCVCYAKSAHKYREARFDKIDSIAISGRKISIYAGGRKVFSFGPVVNPVVTRDVIIVHVEKRYAESAEDSSVQTKPVSCSEAEPISKSGDVFSH
ncbi:MAG TPA: hypothetical protein O0X42_04265 [Methanocorpusculum sp.]|nr:hypothetical protein [Methanocorpusculum sp.]